MSLQNFMGIEFIKSTSLCTKHSADYLEQNAVWEATLSDGTKVIQNPDDNSDIPNPWIRLCKYCYQNNIRIIGVKFRFRDNAIKLVDNSSIYVVRRGIMGSVASKTQTHYYIAMVKTEDKDKLICMWINQPSLVVEKIYYRDIDEVQNSPDFFDNRKINESKKN
jgi:hypothetical protein